MSKRRKFGPRSPVTTDHDKGQGMRELEMTIDQRQAEIGMMSDPMRWPNFHLPLKRYVEEKGGFKRLEPGVLNGGGPTVYLVNMWSLGSPEMKGKRWEDLPHKTYESFEAMVDDGWMVD